jgi:hypothetical protein
MSRHRGAILREPSRKKECKSDTCWTCIRLWDSPHALQELKDSCQVKRSIVCREVCRAQKVASNSEPLYEISCVLGWGTGFVRNTAAVTRA